MLVPRIKIQGDIENDLPLAAAVQALAHFAERFGAGNGIDMHTPDAHAANRLADVTVAHLRRAPLQTPVRVQRHNCPHVPGSEEASWGPCTSPLYEYSETVV